MITVENLKTELKDKEALRRQTEIVYMQIVGQIELLKTLIQKEELEVKEK